MAYTGLCVPGLTPGGSFQTAPYSTLEQDGQPAQLANNDMLASYFEELRLSSILGTVDHVMGGLDYLVNKGGVTGEHDQGLGWCRKPGLASRCTMVSTWCAVMCDLLYGWIDGDHIDTAENGADAFNFFPFVPREYQHE